MYLYILAMAVTTYLIRMLPLTLFRREVKSPFLQSFLYYVPYACLTAMTVPSIFASTRSIWSAVAGFVVAVLVATKTKNLLLVAVFACVGVYLTELFLQL